MTSLEIKNKIIGRINQTEDGELLADIFRLLENSDPDPSVIILSNDHKKAINEARTQISKGEYLNNDEANHEIKKWLNQ